MPLYGYKEVLDNRAATLVVAADSVIEYTEWTQAVTGQLENRNWEETYTSTFLDALRNEAFKGYKHPVLAVYHSSEEQRDAFWREWPIVEVKSMVGRDRHLDMLHAQKEEIREATETEEEKARTIEERFGLDKHDPWDRRSEEEVEADRKMKEKMKELTKKGELSGDSFGGADTQRASRDRPGANNVPGAYGRTQATEALKVFDDPQNPVDYESMTNEQLKEALEAAGVPDVQGVYDDDKVPQKAKASGDIFVESIKGDRNEDGTFDISDIVAHKRGGEVDEVAKAAAEAAHESKVQEAKAGKKAFSPEDFAAVLRGDGSADAITHVEGDNRHTRQASVERPSLSDHAEQARKEHQEKMAEEARNRRAQAKREEDVKARGERDRGIFKGADLISDDEPTSWDDLPENIREVLENANLKRESIEVKDYPYNSELGGRALIPFEGLLAKGGVRLVGTVNADIEGTMTMGSPAVAVVSRTDTSQDGWVILGRRKYAKEAEDQESQEEDSIDIWLVKLRS